MKKTKKVLILGLCAVLLVAASVLGTMAYLTDTAEVRNTFTVGNVAITLDEANVNPDGTKKDESRVATNMYKLMPGHEYLKDPTVHVTAGSEDCFLFVKVENGISGIETTDAGDKISAQMAAKNWKAVTGVENVYVYTEDTTNGMPTAVQAGDNKVVFEKFIIDGDVDSAKFNHNVGNIVVTAYAIQADGFAGKTANEILTTSKLIQYE